MRARIIGSSALTVGLLTLPALAGAASLFDTLSLFNTFLNALIGLFITLAIVVFFWGLIKYLFGLDSSESKSEGLQIMMYGVIAIFVMVSIWGIIRLLQNTFKVTSTDPIIPKGIQINTVSY
ncbi:hypothetical protein A3C20_03330 [Candidatus Kaiserbacteria bacterium RIFCSPHIGHO2_02_FULL_55_25]|uniref:Uncharacterized protein n=1 Tax=Candidatus Kaiserbacteria bacterium RIFCSPHIGHO2_02_FULL_55_25 TaxID=1798498 RepID=A0A1F6E7H0_9BACT|nr:MAG: hypothetical protein A2764_02455 [Candidatus Kaiserbacteria bacterium RIFCSPHIGHO2_01_FULL_55_79]OGG69142.1 MAG: hypothetical protein A3C20_03330 [Candidatus Kaiserbacteria bacterium RIFCSPHIGHO2_02_FULL_55_25]OGG77700.1 MAG: hypothetical protein A3F56_00400 [Candidatus Kaiserbacteria bacterium RIFCSPHIGHO2_12_FULL_55_13]OGG83355.1 MAG: hypothetical protein A3A42_04005 [Candidatus Kaiserbacteria bacterium RIFCSPLOWO2_01_FULL_55_25]